MPSPSIPMFTQADFPTDDAINHPEERAKFDTQSPLSDRSQLGGDIQVFEHDSRVFEYDPECLG